MLWFCVIATQSKKKKSPEELFIRLIASEFVCQEIFCRKSNGAKTDTGFQTPFSRCKRSAGDGWLGSGFHVHMGMPLC